MALSPKHFILANFTEFWPPFIIFIISYDNFSHLMRKGTLVLFGLTLACVATQKGQKCGSLSDSSPSSLYCEGIAKALMTLGTGACSPEPSLFAYLISTIFSWTGSFR